MALLDEISRLFSQGYARGAWLWRSCTRS